MERFTREEAAAAAGVEPAYLDRLVDLGLVKPDDGRCTAGDVRRIMLTRSVEDAGISVEGMAAAHARGDVSLDFLDTPAYERFAALSTETFREASERTGVPVELLFVIREAMGMAQPSADTQLRLDELGAVSFVELQLSVGFRPAAIERLLRVQGEATRRITESEGAWWVSEVIEPALASGKGLDALADADLAVRLSPLSEATVLGMYHAQQARAWTANIIDGFESVLAAAGLHSRLERPPAMCFIDVSGYTRLTQEQGDAAAADLASTVANVVGRSAASHGGKPVKWLGDGVMLYFRDPGPAVGCALGMVDELAAAGLPPAHVGLHVGPVLFQQGDYFGQTVNLASRISDYAGAGEVLVSRAAADASRDDGVEFQPVGPVELKGVTGSVELLRASLRPA